MQQGTLHTDEHCAQRGKQEKRFTCKMTHRPRQVPPWWCGHPHSLLR